MGWKSSTGLDCVACPNGITDTGMCKPASGGPQPGPPPPQPKTEKVEPKPSPAPEKPADNTMRNVLIGAAVLLLVGGVAYVATKPKDGEAPGGEAPPGDEPPPGDEG